MKFPPKPEAPPGVRDRREKHITIMTEQKWEKVPLWFKSIKDLPVQLEGSAYIF